MSNRRTAARLPASLFAAIVLVGAACGDGTQPTTSLPPDPVAATTAPTPEATDAGPVTVAATTTLPPPTTGPATATSTSPSPSPTTTPAVSSPPPGWSELTVAGPGARSNAVLAGDPGGHLYLHGGRSAGEPQGDLWRYDIAAGTWAQLDPEGIGPSARFSHTAVWDGRRDRLVIFSGQRGSGEFFSDVWAYDPASNSWSELAGNRAGPENRYGSCAGYDPAGDRFLISHGFTDGGRFDDTWAFDLGSNAWGDVSPGEVRPLRRCLHTCTYDEEAAALILFGGQSNDQFAHDDAWVLADSTWTEVAQPGPAARKFTSSSGLDGGAVVFGGEGEDTYGDTWVLATGGNPAWSEASYGPGPAARHSHAAAHDPATGRLWVFGGETEAGEAADLWMLQT